MTTQTTTARIGANAQVGLAGQVSKPLDAFGEWRRIRRDERYLLELSDEALKDIGLTRSAIVGALRGEVRG